MKKTIFSILLHTRHHLEVQAEPAYCKMLRKAFSHLRIWPSASLVKLSPSKLYAIQQKRMSHVEEQLFEIESRYQIIDIEQITKRLGVRLTENEFSVLRELVDVDKDGLVSRTELTSAGRQALDDHSAREVCLSVVELPTTRMDRAGSWACTQSLEPKSLEELE